ncbi:MAG TPA: T9SS type A sorting domain-containing protein, partial [Bacteroidia bacterium]|nr:T9SS type A sorting domain-containing protein [Bacteroidia bacterium]
EKVTCAFSFNDITIDSLTGCAGPGSENCFTIHYNGSCTNVTMQIRYFKWLLNTEVTIPIAGNGTTFSVCAYDTMYLTSKGVMLFGTDGSNVDSLYFKPNRIKCNRNFTYNVSYDQCGAQISGVNYPSGHCNPLDTWLKLKKISDNNVDFDYYYDIASLPNGTYLIGASDAGCNSKIKTLVISGAVKEAPTGLSVRQVDGMNKVKIRWKDECPYYSTFDVELYQIQIRPHGSGTWQVYKIAQPNYSYPHYYTIIDSISLGVEYDYRIRTWWAGDKSKWSSIRHFCFGGGCAARTVSENDVNENNVALTVYPNPANDVINFNFEDAVENQVVYTIYNQLGKLVMTNNTHVNSDAMQLNVSSLNNGLYFIA